MSHTIPDISPDTLPAILPIFPLEGAVLLPRGQLPLQVFEPRYLKLVAHVLGQGRLLGIVQPLSASDKESDNASDKASDKESDKKSADGLHQVGCLGRITAFNEIDDERLFVSVTGISRFRVGRVLESTTPYPQVAADYAAYGDDLIVDVGALDVNRDGVLDVLRRYLAATDMSIDWQAIEAANNESLVNSLSIISPYGVLEKQALLEAASLSERAEILIALTERVLAQMAADEHNDNILQ